MKTKKFVMLIIFLLLITVQLLFVFQTQAYTDEYVDVQLFFTWMDEDGSWHQWVDVTSEYYTEKNLNVNQTIKCKIHIVPHIKSAVSFRINEPGTNTFQVLEGNQHDKSVVNTSVEPNTSIEYTWVLKTTNRWIGGRTPINIYWQVTLFEVNDDGYAEVTDTVSRTQTFANPYIENEEWTGPSYISGDDDDDTGIINTNENNNTSTPGFESIFLFLAVICIFFIRKYKSHRI